MSKKNRKSITENHDLLHLEEVEMHCALCAKLLLNKGDIRINKDYEIAHIYPCNPTLLDLMVLDGVKKNSENSEDFKNKIALCVDCHRDYDRNKTIEKYNNLLELKNEKYDTFTAKRNISSFTIEDDITSIITALYNISDEDILSIERLSHDALYINKKIETKYRLLRRKISDNVSQYFKFIQQEFKNLDSSKNRTFKLIEVQIKGCYLKCTESTEDKDVIFDIIVDWLYRKTKINKSACEIMISFFVQNCDIYDEITE